MIYNERKLLFWGELPPETVHGISLSNQRILNSLSKNYKIITVIDRASFGGLFRKLFFFTVSLGLLAFNALKKCDYFYVNAPMSKLGLWRVYLAVRVVSFISPKTKVVSHLHRGDFLEFVSQEGHQKLFSKFSMYVDKLLVLANQSKQEIVEYNLFPESKVSVLFNTIVPSTTVDDTLVGENEARYLFCLCNYIETKRIDSLVKLANQLSYDVEFNGVTSSQDYMRSLEQLDLGGHCSFGGVIRGEQKEEKLKGAKALVLPSLNEGMPLVLLESLAQGTPVICFDVGYIKEYLGDGYPGLVKELTDESLGERLQWLEDLSEEDYVELRRRSFELFWDNFDPAKICIHTRQLFS
ncbi:glycosyltransferase family 4 protein [Vibrio parahaemolyticus]|uniref:glycosyltransferase family 4 protein n=1 Tax=Vibrio parahaemolyticus TaxID=670 RepID=UPI0011230A5B|nr:glycosyltransferase family 4 protein [Vibrio parahaemolyticus]MBD2855471.1 glycosyltransferase family 4 protein [Vibrio parahaemolyticus]MBW6448166.1 glycosyltransferase family 4 protein [Vibrio parahaemolyticus]TPA37754.1 glycosyltransferase family 1 protein [Vibrio parahaemolyticus]HAS3127665.1 glycosyltransferase family 4 protein [Vibrio parahaemolyticus]